MRAFSFLVLALVCCSFVFASGEISVDFNRVKKPVESNAYFVEESGGWDVYDSVVVVLILIIILIIIWKRVGFGKKGKVSRKKLKKKGSRKGRI